MLALTLRGRRQAALGPEVAAAVDDYPEETKAQQARASKLTVISKFVDLGGISFAVNTSLCALKRRNVLLHPLLNKLLCVRNAQQCRVKECCGVFSGTFGIDRVLCGIPNHYIN